VVYLNPGIKVQRRQGFVVADGRRVERDIGYATFSRRCRGPLMMWCRRGERFRSARVRSLEGLNLRLDVVRKELVDAGPVLAVALTNS